MQSKSVGLRELRIGTSTPTEYLNELASARALITSAGLNSFYEACFMRTPAIMLPPQNLSQEVALTRLRQAGICEGARPWSEVYPDLPDMSSLTQPEACDVINHAIRQFSRDDVAKVDLMNRLQAGAERSESSLIAQSIYFDRVWSDGAQAIAAATLRFLE
jgi:UDP-N-acetylglucosamine:LPS N-acetylglucosamine transferase